VTDRILKLTLEYDGARFRGWQVQPELRTVQGELEQALRTLLGHPVSVQGSGRTDAGVHARAQVASLKTTSELPLERIRRGINGLTDEGVSCLAVQEAPSEFHARGSARGKVYAYRVLARSSPSPLSATQAWHVPYPLDEVRLAAELATLPGRFDWSAYRAADCQAPDAVKTLARAELRPERWDELTLVFEGSGFLKQMVRILVGTAIDVARGRLEAGAMVRIREAGVRAHAGPTAPPHGLTLERVLY